MKRVFRISLIIVLLVPLFSCATQATPDDTATTEEKYRVALVVPGNINDLAWSQMAYEALMYAKDELDLDVAYKENVPTEDGEDVMRVFASQGFDLVIGHGQQYVDAALAAGADFPDTEFMVDTGTEIADNVSTINFFDEELTFPAGALAAKVSKTGVVGYIGGREYGTDVRHGLGYEEGAQYTNPDIKVLKTYTGDFNDAGKAKEAALAMIEQGADVIFYWLDAGKVGVFEAAKENNIWVIGSTADQHQVEPDIVLSSAIQDFNMAFADCIAKAKRGELEGRNVYGLKSGAMGLTEIYNVPDDVRQYVEQVTQDIIDGKVTVTAH